MVLIKEGDIFEGFRISKLFKDEKTKEFSIFVDKVKNNNYTIKINEFVENDGIVFVDVELMKYSKSNVLEKVTV